MSSRALPIAVVGFSLVFFWAWVWFAFAGGGTLTDPAEILTQGAQATADADSFHVSVTVEGTVTDASLRCASLKSIVASCTSGSGPGV